MMKRKYLIRGWTEESRKVRMVEERWQKEDRGRVKKEGEMCEKKVKGPWRRTRDVGRLGVFWRGGREVEE